MYCKLFFKHFSATFTNKARSLEIIPLTSRELLVIFKDCTYLVYDTLVQSIVHEAKLPETVKPDKIHTLPPLHILFIYPTRLYFFNVKKYTFQKYDAVLPKEFSGMVYFEESQSLAMTVEKHNLEPVELIHLFLLHPDKPQSVQLNSNFKQPHLLKTSANTYVIVSLSHPKIHVREMTILVEESDIVETFYYQTAVDILSLFGCFYKNQKIDLIGQKKEKMILIEYDYLSNTVETQDQILRDNILIVSVPVCLDRNYGVIYIDPQTSQHYFALTSQEGIKIDELKLKSPLSLQNSKLSMDGLSFYDFMNCNEKWIEKVKSQVPTLIKFNQVKIIGKEKFYFHMLKQIHSSKGEGLWRRVLRILK